MREDGHTWNLGALSEAKWRTLVWGDDPPGVWGYQGPDPGLSCPGSSVKGSGCCPHPPLPLVPLVTQTVAGQWGRSSGEGRTLSDLNLCPEGLLDVLRVWVTSGPDGEAAIFPQGRGHRCGVHVIWQLALVSKGVHDGAICRQLGKGPHTGQGGCPSSLSSHSPSLSILSPSGHLQPSGAQEVSKGGSRDSQKWPRDLGCV